MTAAAGYALAWITGLSVQGSSTRVSVSGSAGEAGP